MKKNPPNYPGQGDKMEKYSNSQLFNMLLELDVEEIKKVYEEFKAEHPDCPTLSLICRLALRTKQGNDDKNRNDLVALIQKVRKKGCSENTDKKENELQTSHEQEAK